MPPKGNIVEVLKGMKGHETVLKMLQNTQLDKMLEEDGTYTFLAPSDEAFDRFSDRYRQELVENVTKAEEVLKMHILPETLCCNGISRISPFHRQYLRTLSGDLLPAHNMYNSVKFGRARATHCDISASNGLVHSVNRVIFPQKTTIMTFFGI